MDATTGQVSSAAAERYEEFFVPALFGQWPDRLLDAAGVRRGDVVLDVGAGPASWRAPPVGGSGRRARWSAWTRTTAMLAVARRTAPDVRWVEGVAERLPIESDGVDRVLCQFAAMFFADPGLAVAEMRRVLRPGGLAVLATWAEVSASPGYDALVALIRRVAGDEPAEALLAPFRIGTERALRDLVAGSFEEVRVETWDGAGPVPVARCVGHHRGPGLDARRDDLGRPARPAARRRPGRARPVLRPGRRGLLPGPGHRGHRVVRLRAAHMSPSGGRLGCACRR